MSHNKIKVGGQGPNVNGEITVSINNLSDVDITSPSDGQAIGYDGSNFTASTPSLATFDNSSYWRTNGATQGTLSNYNTSYENPFYLAARYKINIYLMEFSNSSDNNIVADTRALNANSIYATGFTIRYSPSQKALLMCDLVIAENSSSGAYIDVQWQTSAGVALGPIVRVHRQSGYNRQTVFGYIDTAGETAVVDVGLKRLAQSGTLGWAQSTDTRQNVIFFAKLVG
jgi:hypothetical protein